MDPNHMTEVKEEALRWIFSIAGALLVYFIAATIAQHLYHPDIELLKRLANEKLVEPFSSRPEPMEALLFRLGVISIIPSMLVFYIVLSKAVFVKTIAKT